MLFMIAIVVQPIMLFVIYIVVDLVMLMIAIVVQTTIFSTSIMAELDGILQAASVVMEDCFEILVRSDDLLACIPQPAERVRAHGRKVCILRRCRLQTMLWRRRRGWRWHVLRCLWLWLHLRLQTMLWRWRRGWRWHVLRYLWLCFLFLLVVRIFLFLVLCWCSCRRGRLWPLCWSSSSCFWLLCRRDCTSLGCFCWRNCSSFWLLCRRRCTCRWCFCWCRCGRCFFLLLGLFLLLFR